MEFGEIKPNGNHGRLRAKIVHLSSGHDADDARIYWKECVTLAESGYDVTFIVPCEQPPRCASPHPCLRIIAVPRAISRRGRLIRTPFSVLRAALRQNAEVYHFHDPELLPAGLLLRLLGKRVIYDVHEDLPRDILIKPWIPRPIRRLIAGAMSVVERLAGTTLSGFVAATPVIARRFPVKRTALVQNFAHLTEFTPPELEYHRRKPAIAYVGGITVERCATEMVEAMHKLDQFPRARLIIAGRITPPGLVRELQALQGWDRVHFRGQLNRQGVRDVLCQARIGLALFYPKQSYIESQPVKLFEYMAAGIPVIASDFPRFRDILEGHGCGLCIPPRDVDKIADAIHYLLANPEEAAAMGKRGRILIEQAFNWEKQVPPLLDLYGRILSDLNSEG